MQNLNEFELKPAYEFDGISIVFTVSGALGDSIISKKVFETIIDVEKNCKIDLFCKNKSSILYAKNFYIDSKNFNCIIDEHFFNENINYYDLALNVTQAIHILFINFERIRQLSPKLFEILVKINIYNQKYIYSKDFCGKILFNMARARILDLNCFT